MTGSLKSFGNPETAAAQNVRARIPMRARSVLSMLGPAVMASIAYMDPGNFATNIQAGAKYGYSLLWVVVLSNILAMLFQALAAKLGIVTGKNLAELSRDHFSKPLVITMWVGSEVAAMATDLAEFVGASLGFSLLAGIPILIGMLLTAVLTYFILSLQRRGYRPLEIVIGSLIGVIALSYVVELCLTPIDWKSVGLSVVTPGLTDQGALTLAVGIIGATIMPHAIYLHSSLTQRRPKTESESDRIRLVRFSNFEVVLALTLAGLINMAMLIMASGAFHAGHSDVAELETAYHTLAPLLGPAAAGFFLLSLIASGVSSSVVGTMAGQVIMQGFTGIRIPLWFRRAVTILPAFVVIALGVNLTHALVMSQVVLSIMLPIPLITLIVFTSKPAVMGSFANGRFVTWAAALGTVLILLLNLYLILDAFGFNLAI